MKSILGHSISTKIVGLAGIALVIAAFLIVRPVLAQEDASSSAPVDNSSTSTEPTLSESTSTQSDTAASEATTSDPSSTTDTSTTPASDSATSSTIDTSTTPASDIATTASASADVAPQNPVEAPPVGFTEVHIIGTKYIDYFTDGTTTTAFPGDPEIDSHFSERNAPIPAHEGLTWVQTTGRPLYDTPSGDLEGGQYAIQSNGKIEAKYPPFVSSTSTPSTAASSSAESNSATAPEVLGASTSSDASSSAGTSTSVSATDAATDTNKSEQSDTVTATSASSSTGETGQ